MPVTADRPAPYATPGAIIDLIQRHRNRGLPAPITNDVLGRAGIAQTLIPRTLQTLYTLDLVDPETGMPTAVFEGLRLAPEAEFKKRVEDWLKGTYADVFAFVDPAKDGEERIRDAFRSYHPVGQQFRMVALFQALCSAAGLLPEKTARTVAPEKPAPVLRPRQAVRQATEERHKDSTHHQSSVKTKATPAAITGLIASLPSEGEGWTTEHRDKFLVAFETVLDLCFPVVPHRPQPAPEEDEAA